MRTIRMTFILLIIMCFSSTAYTQPAETWRTGQTTCYWYWGPQIDCTDTGQDGDIQAGVEWPTPRFTDNGNGTVTDSLTGLIWLKDANCAGYMTWQDALTHCNNLAHGSCGLSDGSVAGDWRLPNRKELFSLIDFGEYYPALPQGHPFNDVQAGYTGYWSSTSLVSSSNAWVVYMYSGDVASWSKISEVYVWPVRGGGVMPQQETECFDGADNDGDGTTDCADSDCNGATDGWCDTGQEGICADGTQMCTGGVQVCEADNTPQAEGPPGHGTCSDGLDNDCDGLTDGVDPNCQVPVETECFDGADNDGDGATDCADSDCNGATDGWCDTGQPGICTDGTLMCTGGVPVCEADNAPQTEGPPGNGTCSDGLDNDCDGLTDGVDPNCQVPVETECFDGADNDGDGTADCGDSDCNGATNGWCDSGQPGLCSDGTRTCSAGTEICVAVNNPQPEGPPGDETCSDGLDNDCDGSTDYGDIDCFTGNTPPGSNVEVCESTGDVCVNFRVVEEPGGSTTITVVDCPAPPDGIILPQTNPTCIQIETTASFNGAEVCITYDDADCVDPDPLVQELCERDLDVFRCENGSCSILPNISQDIDQNIICVLTNQFSLFIVGTAMDSDTDGIPDLEDNCPQDQNFFQEDDDNDGVGNACDLCLNHYDPTNQCSLCEGDFLEDGDVDGHDLVLLMNDPGQLSLAAFAAHFGRLGCPIPVP